MFYRNNWTNTLRNLKVSGRRSFQLFRTISTTVSNESQTQSLPNYTPSIQEKHSIFFCIRSYFSKQSRKSVVFKFFISVFKHEPNKHQAKLDKYEESFEVWTRG